MVNGWDWAIWAVVGKALDKLATIPVVATIAIDSVVPTFKR
jgi:hypothetical protein